MNLKELRNKINELKKMEIDASPIISEFQRRYTWSLTPLLFILLGFPFAVITHRREKSANAILAVLCAAPYYILSLACQGLATQNAMPPVITMWIPNIIAGIIVIIFNYKLCVS